MTKMFPEWMEYLRPIREPTYGPFCRGSDLMAWHVPIELTPWAAPIGTILSGSDNWNGKALVVGADSGLDRSVGQVEIAARLGVSGAFAGWTGNPRSPWSKWALDKAARATWVNAVDGDVRQSVPLLEGNARGRPDVIQWRAGRADFCCVEYKGPSPMNPSRADTVKPEQTAWVATAVERSFLSSDRIAIVSWRPSAECAAVLMSQAAASKLGREEKRAERAT